MSRNYSLDECHAIVRGVINEKTDMLNKIRTGVKVVSNEDRAIRSHQLDVLKQIERDYDRAIKAKENPNDQST